MKIDKNYKLNFQKGDKVLVRSGYSRAGEFSGEFVEFSSYKDESKEYFFDSQNSCWDVYNIKPFIEIEDDEEINKCLKSMTSSFYKYEDYKDRLSRAENNDSISYMIYSDFINTFNRMCDETPYLTKIFKKCLENFDKFTHMVIFYKRKKDKNENY